MISFSNLGNCGRLGNQLFQYAFLRSLARRLGVQFYCPPWEGDEIFDLRDEGERARAPSGIRHFHDQAPESGFTSEAPPIVDGTEIQGYFQSEKYYDDPASVRSWYAFRQPIVDEVMSRYGHLPLSECPSFSLRLDDDYNNSREFFPLYPRRYYHAAAAMMGLEGPVIVFADRPDRAREYLRGFKARELIFIEDLGAPQQLYLMTQCGANVITNSTFAWWGAWLNEVPGSRVYAPTHWNRPGVPIPTREILCESWIKVPCAVPVWDHFQVWRARHPVALAKRVSIRLKERRLARAQRPLIARAEPS